MLQQIDSAHLAALESELARVRAQRDALQDALRQMADATEHYLPHGLRDERSIYAQAVAALKACQD